VFSTTAYNGYWWGINAGVANEQTVGETTPVADDDIESNAINMEE